MITAFTVTIFTIALIASIYKYTGIKEERNEKEFEIKKKGKEKRDLEVLSVKLSLHRLLCNTEGKEGSRLILRDYELNSDNFDLYNIGEINNCYFESVTFDFRSCERYRLYNSTFNNCTFLGGSCPGSVTCKVIENCVMTDTKFLNVCFEGSTISNSDLSSCEFSRYESESKYLSMGEEYIYYYSIDIVNSEISKQMKNVIYNDTSDHKRREEYYLQSRKEYEREERVKEVIEQAHQILENKSIDEMSDRDILNIVAKSGIVNMIKSEELNGRMVEMTEEISKPKLVYLT